MHDAIFILFRSSARGMDNNDFTRFALIQVAQAVVPSLYCNFSRKLRPLGFSHSLAVCDPNILGQNFEILSEDSEHISTRIFGNFHLAL
jgi:hypothetical protein